VKWVWAIAKVGVMPQLETPATVIGLLFKALKMQSA